MYYILSPFELDVAYAFALWLAVEMSIFSVVCSIDPVHI